jgi:hypothetical protein
MPVRIFKTFITCYLLFMGLVTAIPQEAPAGFADPAREFSVMPFWFWNDTLKEEEIIMQIADFEDHGVYGFVIHPRIGLPGDVTWLSGKMISAMRTAVEEAARRNMYVILYDEGMYPSGSSGGQVVARNPEHAARGLAKIDLKPGEEPVLRTGVKLLTTLDRPVGNRLAVVEQPSGGVIRGLHYLNEGEQRLREDSPPAGDILNPDAVSSFIDLVYNRYALEFGSHFGKTIIGIFTDEPSPLGRSAARGLVPGNIALLDQVNEILGYDFKPFLADLWYADTPESLKHRSDYQRAVNICLEENYYRRLGNWCLEHNVALMGHPAGSMDIGAQKYFQIPGQDLVWRYVEPGPKALEGQHSTMAKCASSAMIHLGLRRNSNELYGAYGHNLTHDEMLWLANWCFVRGQNFLIPHAFYYSVRGPRVDERPPDVGPNSTWWDSYRSYADACRRLSWINTDSKHICNIAILCEATWLPEKAAKTCYQNQQDFNYLDVSYLEGIARAGGNGLKLAGMNYSALVVDSISYLPDGAERVLRKLARKKRLIVNSGSWLASQFPGTLVYHSAEDLVNALGKTAGSDLHLTPHSENIRYRHVEKEGAHYYLLFNEEATILETKLNISASGKCFWLSPADAKIEKADLSQAVKFEGYELKILYIPAQ